MANNGIKYTGLKKTPKPVKGPKPIQGKASDIAKQKAFSKLKPDKGVSLGQGISNIYEASALSEEQKAKIQSYAPSPEQKVKEVDPLALEKAKLEKEAGKFQEMQSQITGLSEQVFEQLGKASESFQKSFVQLSETLGGQVDLFANQMQKIKAQTGMVLDLENPDFLAEANEIIEQGGTDFMPVMQKYLVKQEFDTPEIAKLMQDAKMAGVPSQAVADLLKDAKDSVFPIDVPANLQGLIAQQKTGTGEKPEATAAPVETYPLPDKNPGAGYSTDIVPESSPSEQVAGAMENIGGMNGDSIISFLEAAGHDFENMSSAEAMQVMTLQWALTSAEDPAYNDFVTKMTEYTMGAYQSVVDNASITVAEIDAIISGEDVAPTTFDSLNAKIYKQQADLATEGIELEKGWLTAQYDAWMTQEQDKRGRLEGYLKGKLYAAGAQDSSAGLSVMALQVNAADMRLQLKASEYQYSMGKLNLESRGIMENYTNNIVGLNMNAEAKISEAANTFQEKMFEVEGLALENAKEKNKLKMDALSTFNDNMYKIDQDKKTWAWKEYEQSYKEMQDSISNAFDLSGMMGTAHYIDENGEVVDSGIPTFDAKKWEDTQWLDHQKFQNTLTQDNIDMAFDLIDRGGNGASIASMLGLDPSLFSGVMSAEEYKMAIQGAYDKGSVWDNYVNVLGGSAYESLADMDGQYMVQGLQGVDPMVFPEIQSAFAALDPYITKITQDFDTPVDYLGGYGMSTHGGYDIVFNDGMIHSLNSGVVREIIPNGTNTGWGAQIVIQDYEGKLYQYSHFENEGVGVSVGDTINVGDTIGAQGSAGHSTGPHLDWRLVGYDSNILPQTLGNLGNLGSMMQKTLLNNIAAQAGAETSGNQKALLDVIASGLVGKEEVESAYTTALINGNMDLASSILDAYGGEEEEEAPIGVSDATLEDMAYAYWDTIDNMFLVKGELKTQIKDETGSTPSEADLNALYSALKKKTETISQKDVEAYQLSKLAETTSTFDNFLN